MFFCWKFRNLPLVQLRFWAAATAVAKELSINCGKCCEMLSDVDMNATICGNKALQKIKTLFENKKLIARVRQRKIVGKAGHNLSLLLLLLLFCLVEKSIRIPDDLKVGCWNYFYDFHTRLQTRKKRINVMTMANGSVQMFMQNRIVKWIL